jgi:hypothetical protein
MPNVLTQIQKVGVLGISNREMVKTFHKLVRKKYKAIHNFPPLPGVAR